MRIVRCGAAVLCVGASLLVGAPAYGGGVPLLEATVSPDPSTPGAPITITPATIPGDLCPEGGETVQWHVMGDTFATDGTVDVDGSGDWTVEMSAPVVGTYDFEAECVGPLLQVNGEGFTPAGAASTLYAQYTATFEVVGELDPFQAILDQSSGPPGDDIELGAIACFGDSGAALFMPPGPVPAFSPDLVDQGLQQYDVVDNQFGGVVPVPADTAPGTYQVVAWCLDAGQLAADPVVLGYTVLAPGAAPVAADPDFTG